MPRFNKSGLFNTSVHHRRNGIKIDKFSDVCMDWSRLLNRFNVVFECKSYETIETNKNDFIYLDPPYANTKGIYYGKIDYKKFWNWLRKQNCNYILSFDGMSGNDNNTYSVPLDVYSEHLYLKSGKSSFKRIYTSNDDMVYESVYIK
jgi:DNA adenine methylase